MTDAHDRTRVGTEEREQAISLLSEHFSAGRLTIEEFSQRCASAGAAVTRGELSSVVADLPRATTIGFGARLQQGVAERIHADEQIAKREAAAAEMHRRAAAAPAAELQACLEELAVFLSSRVKPSRAKLGQGLESRLTPEGFPVFWEGHAFKRDSQGSPVRISAEVLLPDGRLWKSWYQHAYMQIEKELSEYGSVKIGPFAIHFDRAGRLYAQSRNPNTYISASKNIELADALADIATCVIKQGESARPAVGRAGIPKSAKENIGIGATLRRLLLAPGGQADR